VVDVEVYAPSGTRVFQQAWDNQAFSAGQRRTFNATWAIPSGAATGAYRVKMGVFQPAWAGMLAWNDNAGSFTVGAASATTSLVTTADTFTSSSSKNTSYGTAQWLRVDGSPSDAAYLKFDLASLAGKTLTDVKLRVRTTSDASAGSAGPLRVRLVGSQDWSEATLTYANRPALSTVVGTLPGGSVPSTWYEVTLTPAALQAYVGGRLTLGLDTTSDDMLVLASRETVDRPTLVVRYR
jgi:hypothetical protein